MGRRILAETARDDILRIRDFTLERWGSAPAKDYVTGLRSRLRQLAENPQLGRLRADIAPALRSASFRAHLIF